MYIYCCFQTISDIKDDEAYDGIPVNAVGNTVAITITKREGADNPELSNVLIKACYEHEGSLF